MWILVALHEGPRHVVRLLDDVRSLDGPIGPGTLFSALARLEYLALIERVFDGAGRGAYRLTQLGEQAAGSVGAIRGEART
jgi:DNA-binding PadR family transcriptional regulator